VSEPPLRPDDPVAQAVVQAIRGGTAEELEGLLAEHPGGPRAVARLMSSRRGSSSRVRRRRGVTIARDVMLRHP
jgi:hypothetical protein